MIHGIIDIGSNTIRLAIYKVDNGKLELLIKKKHTVGLAAYIQNNVMQPEGIQKACEVLAEFKVFLSNFNITNVVAFTTAALRNVENSKEAVAQIIHHTGIDIIVISGNEEAAFDFIGATHAMETKDGILIDIGGASTELVSYNEGAIVSMISMPIGSLAMHTKHVKGLFPSKEEEATIKNEVLLELESAVEFKNGIYKDICGIGGTFNGAVKLNNELFSLSESNDKIEVTCIRKMINKFEYNAEIISKENLELLLKVVPERIKTIIPGLIILDTLASQFQSETITVSKSGVREGYLYDKVLKKKIIKAIK
jgi:exopolyphosphatase/guanosine-5'-triphosphate,3'-diphosphate pyrophosphatase